MKTSVVGLLLSVLVLSVPTSAQVRGQAPGPGNPPAAGQELIAQGNARDYMLFKAPSGEFAVEFPKKDWKAAAGAGTLVTFVEMKRGEATVVIEQQTLMQPIAPDQIGTVSEAEQDIIRERRSGATEIAAAIADRGGQRIVVVNYTIPGIAGPSRVRQYSFLTPKRLYRMTCSTAAAKFTEYEKHFSHMASTFNAGSAP